MPHESPLIGRQKAFVKMHESGRGTEVKASSRTNNQSVNHIHDRLQEDQRSLQAY
jgi:hypothetical protein